MPTAPLKFCATPGCQQRVRRGHCRDHQSLRRQNFAYAPSPLYSGAWRRARLHWLGTHPTCTACGRLANEVDHITPHRGDRVLFWDRANWQSLCKACHSRKTQTEVVTLRERGYGDG